MNYKHILGIDGGASKVFSQLYIFKDNNTVIDQSDTCLLYTSPSPRDAHESRMPSSA